MTKALSAGRELDALVAERVMGETVCQCADRGHHTRWHPTSLGGCDKEIAEPYSTSIAAAWEVVEKLKKDVVERFFMGDCYEPGQFLDGWFASFESGHELGDDWLSVEASAETLPEAICLAALKAVGEDVS